MNYEKQDIVACKGHNSRSSNLRSEYWWRKVLCRKFPDYEFRKEKKMCITYNWVLDNDYIKHPHKPYALKKQDRK